MNLNDFSAPMMEYEDEETRRRRLELERLRREEQAAYANPPQAETAPVEQAQFTEYTPEPVATRAPDQELPVRGLAPGPVAPDMNGYLARNESGGNPNIGYHYQPDQAGQRRSSAYGKYGITTAAYKDIQQVDPYFRDKPIESLSTQDQDRAQTAYNSVLTRQLQQRGIQPNAGDLAAANFLGAQGYSNYVNTGQISPQAAQANGGEAKVRQIVDQRRQFGVAPASNAAVEQGQGAIVSPPNVQPTPQPTQAPTQAPVGGTDYSIATAPNRQNPTFPTVPSSIGAIEAYQKSQDDPQSLLSLRNDTNLPEFIRQRAGDRAFEILNLERERARAQTEVDNKIQAALGGDSRASRELGNILSSKTATFAKMVLAGFISPSLAREYAEELGFGNKTQVVTDSEGKAGLITFSASGKPLEGQLADGKKMTNEQLLNYAAGAGRKLNIPGGTYINDTTGEVGRVVTDERTGVSYVQTDKGRKPLTGFRPQSSTGSLDAQRLAQIQKQNIELAGDWERARIAVAKAGPQASADEAARFNFKYKSNFTPEQFTGVAPQLDYATGQMITPAAAPQAAPQAAAPQAAQPQAAAPQAAGGLPPPPAVGAPPQAQTARVPTAGVSTARPTAGMTPAEIIRQDELRKAAGVENIQVAGKRSESFNKYLDETIAPESISANNIVDTRKQQFAILKRPGIDTNKLFGLYNAAQESPGDQKLSIVRDIFGGTFKNPDDVSKRLAELNLSPAERSALSEFNSLNQTINAATLKKNAGPGSVSDAEQRANRESNVDIGKIPALGAYNIMAQTQFDADKIRYKADWAVSSKHNAQNSIELEREWRKEVQSVNKYYEQMARDRARWLATNGVNNPNAVPEAYRKYPVPEYDPVAGRWIKTRPLDNILGR